MEGPRNPCPFCGLVLVPSGGPAWGHPPAGCILSGFQISSPAALTAWDHREPYPAPRGAPAMVGMVHLPGSDLWRVWTDEDPRSAARVRYVPAPPSAYED